MCPPVQRLGELRMGSLCLHSMPDYLDSIPALNWSFTLWFIELRSTNKRHAFKRWQHSALVHLVWWVFHSQTKPKQSRSVGWQLPAGLCGEPTRQIPLSTQACSTLLTLAVLTCTGSWTWTSRFVCAFDLRLAFESRLKWWLPVVMNLSSLHLQLTGVVYYLRDTVQYGTVDSDLWWKPGGSRSVKTLAFVGVCVWDTGTR